MSDEQPTSVRMPARLVDEVEYHAVLAGESRSEFIRAAIRERVARLDREMDTTTTEEEANRA